jgi:hypothetical protein
MKAISLSIGTCLIALGVSTMSRALAHPTYKVDGSSPKQFPNN